MRPFLSNLPARRNVVVADHDFVSERLRDEAQLLRLLCHRGIVRVESLFQLDGRWAIVMELVEGVDLKRLLKAGSVSVVCTLAIIEQAASAFHYAYERLTDEPLGCASGNCERHNAFLQEHLTPEVPPPGSVVSEAANLSLELPVSALRAAAPAERVPKGAMLVQGAVQGLQLKGEAGTFGFGAVQAWRYSVSVSFDGEMFSDSGSVEVQPGQQVQLVCRESMHRCVA